MSRGGKNKKKQGQASSLNPEAKHKLEKEIKAVFFGQAELGEGSRAPNEKSDAEDESKDESKARSASPSKDPKGSISSGSKTDTFEKGDSEKASSPSMGNSFQVRSDKGVGQIDKSSKRAGVDVASSHAGVGGRKSYSQAATGVRRGATMELDFAPETKGDWIEPCAGTYADAQKECGATLIGAVMGNEITMATLMNFMKRSWPFEAPEVVVKDTGIIVMQFETAEQRDWVLEQGPWSIDPSRPLLLKAWRRGMSTDWSVFKEILTWVRIPDIPPEYCNRYMLSLIGSGIGKPICTDEFTASRKLLSFARLLIEVNAEQTRRKSVKIVHEEGVCELKVIFEWLPKSCNVCSSFGHSDEKCLGKDINKTVENKDTEAEIAVDIAAEIGVAESCDKALEKGVNNNIKGAADQVGVSADPGESSKLDALETNEGDDPAAPGEKSKQDILETDDDRVVEEEECGLVYSGDYAEECVRLVAEAWAVDEEIFDDDEKRTRCTDEEDGLQTPVTHLSLKENDGTIVQGKYKFQQVKTKGVIQMGTKVTLTLEQIYSAISKQLRFDSDEDEPKEEGEEQEDPSMRFWKYVPRYRKVDKGLGGCC